MSTILKALRRLEHEKSAFEARPLQDEIAAVGPPATRRSFPVMGVVLAATAALGLGLGASLWWLWPRAEESSPLAGGSMAPPPAVAAPVVPSEPPVIAVQPVPPIPTPDTVAQAPEPEPVPAPVASAPPPQAFASPVEVVERPAPAPLAEPTPAPAGDTAAAHPTLAADPQAAPKPGELPPFASRRRPLQQNAEVSPPAPVDPPVAVAKLESPGAAPAPMRARSEPVERAAPAAAAPAKPAPRKAPAQTIVRANIPDVFVSSTVWHPQKDRRLAKVALAGGASRDVHEGDAIGSLVVSKIEPSGVIFLHDGVELRRRVGAKN